MITADFEAEKRITTERRVLATVNFVRGEMVNNGESRFHRRETWLSAWVARRDTNCADCQGVIKAGDEVAIGLMRELYHKDCVAWMSETDAYKHSDVRNVDDVEAARLRGGKYGLMSYREFNHEVSVAEGRA
jgi:hypothetical protein